jgi:hypothetical protein
MRAKTRVRHLRESRTIRISVTPDHIDRGVRGLPVLCPVGLATMEVLGARWTVTCRRLYRWPVDGVPQPPIPLPSGVGKRIYDYDRGAAMTPFAFEITIPEPETDE